MNKISNLYNTTKSNAELPALNPGINPRQASYFYNWSLNYDKAHPTGYKTYSERKADVEAKLMAWESHVAEGN